MLSLEYALKFTRSASRLERRREPLRLSSRSAAKFPAVLESLQELGLKTCTERKLLEGIQGCLAHYDTIGRKRAELPYEIDGVVHEVTSLSVRFADLTYGKRKARRSGDASAASLAWYSARSRCAVSPPAEQWTSRVSAHEAYLVARGSRNRQESARCAEARPARGYKRAIRPRLRSTVLNEQRLLELLTPTAETR